MAFSFVLGIPFCLIGTIFLMMIYHSIIRYWTLFSKNNVKFVRGLPFLGVHYRAIFGKEPFADSFVRTYNSFPNEQLFGIYDIGGRPSYLLRDPELIKKVGIKDFDHFTNHTFHMTETAEPIFGRSLFMMRDQRWRDMRSTLSPAFTGSKMKLMFKLLADVSHRFCDFLKNELSPDKTMECDVLDIITRFTNDAIASTAFGLEINSLKEKNNEFYLTGKAVSTLDGLRGLIFLAYGSIPKVMNFFRVRFIEDKYSNYFRKIVHDTIKYREQNNIVRNDMINILMDAKKGLLIDEKEDADVGFATINDKEASVGASANKIQKWSDDDLVAQCMIFFLAGFGTVSTTLSFAAYELAINQDIQQKLYEEILEVKTNLNGKSLSYDVLQKMKYIDQVLSETLRRWPQVPGSDREVTKPYVLEMNNGTKIQLNVGDSVLIPAQGTHLDEQYFPNPTKFDPERFNDENKGNIPSGVYMPFGIGPRACIASRFALMECKAFIFDLLSKYTLEKCAKTQIPLLIKKGAALNVPENGFWIRLRLRE